MYTDCKDIYPSYIELEKKKNGVGDKVNFSTCLIFRDYIKSQAISEVEINYTVADGVWEKALETLKALEEEETEVFEGVPSICKRIIAAKLIYEHFTGEAR